MPKALERKLKAQARKKGYSGRRAAAYVYGTMRKTGWVPSTQKKKKKRKKKAKPKTKRATKKKTRRKRRRY